MKHSSRYNIFRSYVGASALIDSLRNLSLNHRDSATSTAFSSLKTETMGILLHAVRRPACTSLGCIVRGDKWVSCDITHINIDAMYYNAPSHHLEYADHCLTNNGPRVPDRAALNSLIRHIAVKRFKRHMFRNKFTGCLLQALSELLFTNPFTGVARGRKWWGGEQYLLNISDVPLWKKVPSFD